jgi:hypothetical protein
VLHPPNQSFDQYSWHLVSLRPVIALFIR